MRGRRGCNYWRHLLQLVVRRGDGVHLLFVHQLVAFLHLLALLSSSVLEPYLDLQEERNLSAPGKPKPTDEDMSHGKGIRGTSNTVDAKVHSVGTVRPVNHFHLPPRYRTPQAVPPGLSEDPGLSMSTEY